MQYTGTITKLNSHVVAMHNCYSKHVSWSLFITDQLPYSVRILLESAVRNCDEFLVKQTDVKKILDWQKNQSNASEVSFKPSRVILQDFT